jgi:DNA-binding ferritin-like protein (Dps family)
VFAKSTFFFIFATTKKDKSITRSITKNKRIMSQTVELQIEKSRHLIEGLRKHLKGIGGGVTNEEINVMKQAVSQLEEANAEVDRLREELAPKVKQVNAMMVRVKEAYAEKKRTLKGYYPQERWIDYGVPDKR